MYLKLNKQRHLEKPHPLREKRALPTGNGSQVSPFEAVFR